MAEKAEKKPDAAAAPAKGDAARKTDAPAEKKAAGGGLLTKTPVVLGIVMILEAVVLFAGFKFLGGGAPKAATGAEIAAEESHGSAAASHGEGGHGEAAAGGHGGGATLADKKRPIEVPLVEARFPNKSSGRTYLYDIQMVVVTKGEFEKKVKDTIKDREFIIKDRVRTIIAQSDPEKLGGTEPGLETLRRQVKYQLDEIVGENLIDEVLVPRCIPFRADF